MREGLITVFVVILASLLRLKVSNWERVVGYKGKRYGHKQSKSEKNLPSLVQRCCCVEFVEFLVMKVENSDPCLDSGVVRDEKRCDKRSLWDRGGWTERTISVTTCMTPGVADVRDDPPLGGERQPFCANRRGNPARCMNLACLDRQNRRLPRGNQTE